MNDVVVTKVSSGVGRIVLNRPQALNALNEAMAIALREASERMAADDAVRCVLVRGAGGHFMAGGDIMTFHAWLDEPAETRRTKTAELIAVVHATIRALREAPKPVVAAIDGACAGFGLSLAAACDLALAADSTTFSVAYCRIGASPDGGSTFSLPRIVGLKRAMALALTGDRFSARDALEMGLVNQVCADDAVHNDAAALAERLAGGPRRALARTKALMNGAFNATLSEQLALEEQSFLDGVVGAEFEQGVRAFIAKRPPEFPT